MRNNLHFKCLGCKFEWSDYIVSKDCIESYSRYYAGYRRTIGGMVFAINCPYQGKCMEKMYVYCPEIERHLISKQLERLLELELINI